MTTKWNPEDDQEVFDALVGAGASQYDWYRELDEDGETATIVMETGDWTDEGKCIVRRRQFSASELVALVNAIVAEKRAGWKHIQRAVEDDDFDSNDADIVFQHAVLGDLVFG